MCKHPGGIGVGRDVAVRSHGQPASLHPGKNTPVSRLRYIPGAVRRSFQAVLENNFLHSGAFVSGLSPEERTCSVLFIYLGQILCRRHDMYLRGPT